MCTSRNYPHACLACSQVASHHVLVAQQQQQCRTCNLARQPCTHRNELLSVHFHLSAPRCSQAAGIDGQCYETYALLEAQTTYNFLAYPAFNFSQPGEVAGLQGSLEYDFSTMEPITVRT